MTKSHTNADISPRSAEHSASKAAESGDTVSHSSSTSSADSVRWSGRTRGGYFGNWFFMQLIRFLGVRWAYAWLVVVASYFTVASPTNYRLSVDFLKRVLGRQAFWKWPLLVYRHYYSFGVVLLDRLAVIMGRVQIECQIEREESIRECLESGQGTILLGSHVGSTEIGGHFLKRLERPVNLIVLEKEEARIRSLFDQALKKKMFRLLTTDGHPLRSIPIIAAIRRGEIVALTGDRVFGGADLSVPFLGGMARFPIGPYLLAAASGAPIFQVFVLRERFGHYRFFTFPPSFIPRELLRADPEKLRPYVTEYADRLASVVSQYPFQWFNFFPFWVEQTEGELEPLPRSTKSERNGRSNSSTKP